MRPSAPHVGLVYEDGVPTNLFTDFEKAVAADGLDFQTQSRPRGGPIAGLEWLFPTAVMLIISRSYFDGFLKEMGKDHYQVLKGGLKGLRKRFSHVKVTRVGSPGKVAVGQPYSLVYSIWFEGETTKPWKFLVPNELPDPEADHAMDAFFEFLDAYYSGSLSEDALVSLTTSSPAGGTVLLAFNPEHGRIERMNPVTRSFDSAPLTIG